MPALPILTHNMPFLPILRRNRFSDPPPERSYSGELIAGCIIGIIGLILVAFYIKEKGIPWYKRAQQLRKVRENAAVKDQEAALAFPSTEAPHELGEISPRPISGLNETLTDEQRPDIVESDDRALHGQSRVASEATTPQSNQLNSTPVAKPDHEPFPAFDPKYRPSGDGPRGSDASLHSIRDSQASANTVGTVETGFTFGTTVSVGDAVPMRITRHNLRRGSNE